MSPSNPLLALGLIVPCRLEQVHRGSPLYYWKTHIKKKKNSLIKLTAFFETTKMTSRKVVWFHASWDTEGSMTQLNNIYYPSVLVDDCCCFVSFVVVFSEKIINCIPLSVLSFRVWGPEKRHLPRKGRTSVHGGADQTGRSEQGWDFLWLPLPPVSRWGGAA